MSTTWSSRRLHSYWFLINKPTQFAKVPWKFEQQKKCRKWKPSWERERASKGGKYHWNWQWNTSGKCLKMLQTRTTSCAVSCCLFCVCFFFTFLYKINDCFGVWKTEERERKKVLINPVSFNDSSRENEGEWEHRGNSGIYQI